MSKPIPPELVDLIFGFIPLHTKWETTTLNSTLFVCSLVSRLFCSASRRRLFSTVFIGAASTVPRTSAKFKPLIKLLEEHPEVLLSTHAVQINLTRGKSRKWASLNDTVLGRILTLIKTRQRKLDVLRIECSRLPDFDQAFGRRTKQAIMDLLPEIHSLTLNDMAVPATIMEKLPPLQSFHARNLWLASRVSVSQAPPPAFTDTSDVSIDVHSLWEIHQFYQRSRQPPPAYVNLMVDALPVQKDDLTDTIRILVEFHRFKNLTTIRLNHNNFILASDCDVLCLLKTWLEFGTMLLGTASSPSSLTNINIEINYFNIARGLGDFNKTTEILAFMQHIDEFHPTKLVNRHPNLESIQVKVASPVLNQAESQYVSGFRNMIERCIQKLLPIALPIPTPNFGKVIAYYIPLDRL
ncbi:hypothetical protein CPB83DRAFT_932127 [Crepidotus variabilis]|uniref:Uncharacterized protein n=1 Tax=Crepidotus variabilis TaxID=179855 RepID=A0A9P6JQ40_9AGAR|nr:hypothetical protein CPB83DRAFT_932127 [Crepidotus variabilis]